MSPFGQIPIFIKTKLSLCVVIFLCKIICPIILLEPNILVISLCFWWMKQIHLEVVTIFKVEINCKFDKKIFWRRTAKPRVIKRKRQQKKGKEGNNYNNHIIFGGGFVATTINLLTFFSILQVHHHGSFAADFFFG